MGGEPVGSITWVYDGEKFVDGVFEAAPVEIVRLPIDPRGRLVAAPVQIVRVPVDTTAWVTRAEPGKAGR